MEGRRMRLGCFNIEQANIQTAISGMPQNSDSQIACYFPDFTNILFEFP